MDIGWWDGFIGGILLAISYLPQAKRVWDRRKEGLQDISISWLAIGICGTTLMLGYGFIIDQPSIVVLNTLVLCVYAFMLSLAKDRKPKISKLIPYDKEQYILADFIRIPLMSEDELNEYMMGINYSDIADTGMRKEDVEEK